MTENNILPRLGLDPSKVPHGAETEVAMLVRAAKIFQAVHLGLIDVNGFELDANNHPTENRLYDAENMASAFQTANEIGLGMKGAPVVGSRVFVRTITIYFAGVFLEANEKSWLLTGPVTQIASTGNIVETQALLSPFQEADGNKDVRPHHISHATIVDWLPMTAVNEWHNPAESANWWTPYVRALNASNGENATNNSVSFTRNNLIRSIHGSAV